MTDPLTPNDLDAIDAYCEAASPEPWTSRYFHSGTVHIDMGDGNGAHVHGPEGNPEGIALGQYQAQRLHNAGFCVRARADLPRISKAHRALLEASQELAAIVKDVHEFYPEEGNLPFGLCDYYRMEDALKKHEEARAGGGE